MTVRPRSTTGRMDRARQELAWRADVASTRERVTALLADEEPPPDGAHRWVLVSTLLLAALLGSIR